MCDRYMMNGIGRNVLVVKDIDNDMFEQAIFILSPKGAVGYVNNSDEVVKEARRILNGYISRYYMTQKQKKKPFGTFWKNKLKYIGLITGITIMAVVGYIFYMTMFLSIK